jgi:hypothetical protein
MQTGKVHIELIPNYVSMHQIMSHADAPDQLYFSGFSYFSSLRLVRSMA